jgi:hypothetical protein
MMHAHEKSDPAIVAMKPANKAARSATEPSVKEPAAAESVERRVGTKGNADWQSTRRTQSRVSVSQALERIRQMEADCSAVYTRGRSRMRESRLYGSVRGALGQRASLPRPLVMTAFGPQRKFAPPCPTSAFGG